MAYMMDKFKGTYRLRTEIDQVTHNYPKDLKGNNSDLDIYIDCMNNIRIHYYGKGILEAYLPSLGRAHNIIKAIYNDLVGDVDKYLVTTERTSRTGEKVETSTYDYESLYKDEELNKIIFDVLELDSEVLFKFKHDKIDTLEKYLKPKTGGAGISPFSSKNLPKSDFKIPDEELSRYKEITSKLPREDVLKVGHITSAYIKSLANKKNTYDDIKADMKLKCVKGKEYIYMIGKFDKYLAYMQKEVEAILAVK